MTDASNKTYTVDPLTGVPKLLGPTASFEQSGWEYQCFDQTLFAAGGKLYATFDALSIDFSTFTLKPVIPNSLYQIDPKIRWADQRGTSCLLGLRAASAVNGTLYALIAPKN